MTSAGKIKQGTKWVMAASAAHALQNIVALVLILKWWMTPAQLGVATLAISLFPMLDALADLGLGASVVQGGGDARELSTIFWLNVGLSVVLFALLAAGAPWLAALHGEPILATLLVVYGLKLIAQNVFVIPEALLRRELRFKELSIIRFAGNLGAFAAKVGLAAAGWPIWALVAGPLARTIVSAIGVQIVRPWRPRLVLDVRGAIAHVRFGLAATASQILFFFYTNVDYQVVGYVFGAAVLGVYRAAYELVLEPARFLSDVTTQVAFPAFARLRDDAAALRAQFLAFTRQNLNVLLPFVAFLIAAAPDVLAALMPSYVAAAPAARLLCVVGLLRALSFVVPPLLDGMGRPGLTLRYMTIAAVVLPAAFVGFAVGFGEKLGGESVALAWVVGYPVAFVALLAMALPAIGLGAGAYVKNALTPIATTFAAGAAAAAARAMASAAGCGLAERLAVAVVVMGVVLFVSRVPARWARRAANAAEVA
jgi:O-antigen/teichoic acid export membrane protein